MEKTKFEPGLFYDEEMEKYYWVGKSECGVCHKSMKEYEICWVLWAFSSRKPFMQIACNKCRGKLLNYPAKYTEVRKAIINHYDNIPKSCVLAIPEVPVLQNTKDLNTFEAVSLHSDVTKDLGVLWKRDDNMIQIDAKDKEQIVTDKKKLRLLDKKFRSEEEIDEYLKELSTAEPIITYDDKKLIEQSVKEEEKAL
jgi:hypothetical protein